MDLSYDEACAKPKIDFMNFERKQRQLLNELAMKRTQVEELKKELEASNLKIHEMTRSLDLTKNTLTEQEYNLNLALKNAQFFEHQLQSKRDSVTKTRLQQESAVAEAKGLRELLQKAELQNYNLTRELNELKAQHSCDVAYQKELMDQDNKIRAKIAQVTEAVKQCQLSLLESQEFSEKFKLCENVQKSVSFYQQQFYKYKEKYAKLQEKYLFANAVMESFQHLATENKELFHVNQEINTIIDQWDNTTRWSKKQAASQNAIIEKLTKRLQSEKEANAQICKQQSELEEINEQLKMKIKELNNSLECSNKKYSEVEIQTDSVVFADGLIKTEVIELTEDSQECL